MLLSKCAQFSCFSLLYIKNYKNKTLLKNQFLCIFIKELVKVFMLNPPLELLEIDFVFHIDDKGSF